MAARSPQAVKLLLSSFLQGNADHVSTQTTSDTLNHGHNLQDADSGRSTEGRPTVCCTHPRDREAFYTRISTFNSRTWFAKPLWLSPPCCARYGWCNVDRDLLRCVSCKAFLSGKMPSCDDPEVYALCCDRLLSSLQTSHNSLCPWSSYPSPESFLTPYVGSQSEALHDTRDRFTNILALGDKLPLLMLEVISSLDLSNDELEGLTTLLRHNHNLAKNCHNHEDSGSELSFHTAIDPDDLQDSRDSTTSLDRQRSKCSESETQHITREQVAVFIAICGWSARGGNIPQLHCSLCDRRVGLWCYHSYHSHAQPEEANDETDEELAAATPDEPSGGELQPQTPSEGLQLEQVMEEMQDDASGEIEQAFTTEVTMESTSGETPGESQLMKQQDESSEHKTMEDADLKDPGDVNIHTEIVDELLTEKLQQESPGDASESSPLSLQCEDSDNGEEKIDFTENPNSSNSSDSDHVGQGNPNDDIVFYVDNVIESSSSEELESCTLSCDDQVNSDSENKNLIQEVVTELVDHVVTECKEDILSEIEATQDFVEETVPSNTTSEDVNDSCVVESGKIKGPTDSEQVSSQQDIPQLDGVGDDMSENKSPAVADESLHSSDSSSHEGSDQEEANFELNPVHQEEVIQHDAPFAETSSPIDAQLGATDMQSSYSEDNSSNLATSDDDVCVVLDSDDEVPPTHETDMVCASDVNFVPVEDSNDSCYDLENDSDDVGSYEDEYDDSLTPPPHEDQNEAPHNRGHQAEEVLVDMGSSDEEEDWVSEQSSDAAFDMDALAATEHKPQNICDMNEQVLQVANLNNVEGAAFSEVNIAAEIAEIMDSECVQTMNPEPGTLSDTLDSDIVDPETEFINVIDLNVSSIPSQTLSDTPTTYHSQLPEIQHVTEDVEHSCSQRTGHVDDQPELHSQNETDKAEEVNFKSMEDHAMGDNKTDLELHVSNGQMMDMLTGDDSEAMIHKVSDSGDASIAHHSIHIDKNIVSFGDRDGDIADVDTASEDAGVQDIVPGSEDNVEISFECHEEAENLSEGNVKSIEDIVDNNSGEKEKVQDVDMTGDKNKREMQADDLHVDEHKCQHSEEKCVDDDLSRRIDSDHPFSQELEVNQMISDQNASECHQQDFSDLLPEPRPEAEDATLKRKHSDDDVPTDSACPVDVHVQPQRKKRKPTVILNNFCPVSEHRSWCPWVAMTTCTTFRLGGGCERITPGWRKLLELLLSSNTTADSVMVQMAKITPPHNNLRSIRHILDQWTSQSTCVDQTTL